MTKGHLGFSCPRGSHLGPLHQGWWALYFSSSGIQKPLLSRERVNRSSSGLAHGWGMARWVGDRNLHPSLLPTPIRQPKSLGHIYRKAGPWQQGTTSASCLFSLPSPRGGPQCLPVFSSPWVCLQALNLFKWPIAIWAIGSALPPGFLVPLAKLLS